MCIRDRYVINGNYSGSASFATSLANVETHARRATELDPSLAEPHAGDVARLAALAFARGEALAPERVEPAYLRDNVALTIAEQQALRASR